MSNNSSSCVCGRVGHGRVGPSRFTTEIGSTYEKKIPWSVCLKLILKEICCCWKSHMWSKKDAFDWELAPRRLQLYCWLLLFTQQVSWSDWKWKWRHTLKMFLNIVIFVHKLWQVWSKIKTSFSIDFRQVRLSLYLIWAARKMKHLFSTALFRKWNVF